MDVIVSLPQKIIDIIEEPLFSSINIYIYIYIYIHGIPYSKKGKLIRLFLDKVRKRNALYLWLPMQRIINIHKMV